MRAAHRSLRRLLVASIVALVAASCSNGGGSSADDATVRPFAEVQDSDVAFEMDPDVPGRAVFHVTTTIPMICSITWGPTEELGNQNNSLTMDGTGIEQHDVVLPGAEAGEEYFFTVLRTARFAALDGVTGQVVRFDVDSSSGGNTGAVEIRVLAPTG